MIPEPGSLFGRHQGANKTALTSAVGESLVLVRHRLAIEETLEDGSTSSRIPVSEPLDGFVLWLELKDKQESIDRERHCSLP